MDDGLREKLRQVFKEGYFLERQRISLRGINPVDTPPAWLTEEVRDALSLVEEPHSRKKRTTLLRVAEAKASGAPIKEVFKSKDCGSEPVWYGRYSPTVKPGWMHDEYIAAALTLATTSAHAYYDNLEEQRVVIRRKILDATQDRLTEISGAAVEVLFDIMLDDETAADVRRKAAVDTLTHAAPETAPKSEQKIELGVTSVGPSMRDIKNRQRRLPGRAGDAEVVEEEVPVLEGVVEGEGEFPPPPPRGGVRIPEAGLYDAPPSISGNGHGEEEEEEDS